MVPNSAGRAPAAFAWTGVPALYLRAGYTVLVREGRPIYPKQA